jgi:hypothetical protein
MPYTCPLAGANETRGLRMGAGAGARIGYEARPLGVDVEFDGAHGAGVNERSC